MDDHDRPTDDVSGPTAAPGSDGTDGDADGGVSGERVSGEPTRPRRRGSRGGQGRRKGAVGSEGGGADHGEPAADGDRPAPIDRGADGGPVAAGAADPAA
ncbi:MAG: hypothetical protein WD225_11590, partial [Ilumatobacteraceae bacterium]